MDSAYVGSVARALEGNSVSRARPRPVVFVCIERPSNSRALA